ncbi:hypothetical protein B0H12DRAFT_1301687 [Mycena haematopus]|nr:hypothetical protein B0H12DRAFT_1301687 [Mycena haematopus]
MGGKNLLDIIARNEAIAVTWLKTYLNFGPDRPLWCFVADEVLAKRTVAADLNVDEAMRINAYLQSWAPYQSEDNLKSKDLADMMQVGRKYGVKMEVLAVSRELQDDMPVWYHRFSGGDKTLFNAPRPVVKCLKDNHKLRFVRETRALASKIGTVGHTNRVDCPCASCQVTKAISGCRHPSTCYMKARDLLNSLAYKWDPWLMQPEDYEEYQAPREKTNPDAADFDARITTRGTLADTFRIFTEGNQNLSYEAPDVSFAINQGPEVVAYTDGSAIDNATDKVRAGAGVYFGDGDPRNKAIRIPDEMGPSNQVGEILAIKEAVEAAPLDAPLKIFSDSKYAIDGLTKYLQNWQDDGFHTVSNGDIFELTVTTV